MSNNQNYFTKILQSRISKEDILKNPGLKNALENDKHMRLEFLSSVKPNMMSSDGYKSEKRKNIIKDMNTFKDIYYKDYMSNKHQLEKIYKISNENSVFLNHFSGFNKYYNNENQKEILNNIQLEYKKKTGFAPIIKENGNLFSSSILLQNDKDLRQYISLDMDTIKKDKNSLSFMKNVRNRIKLNGSNNNKNIENIGNQEIAKFNDKPTINENDKKKIEEKKSIIMPRDTYEDINDLQNEIIKTTESFNSIDDLNFFLNTNNQQYFNYIGNLGSRQSSGQASTRVNSGIPKFSDIRINDDINNFRPNRRNNTKPSLYNINNNIQKIYKANNTFDNINNENNKKSKNHNSLVLPYINNIRSYNNTIQNESMEDSDNIKYRKNTLDYIKIAEPKNSDISIQVNDETNKDIKNNSKIIEKKRFSIKKRKSISLKKHPIALENLYEKLSKTDESIKYNKEIKNYLKKNRYKINDKINDNDLYRSVDRSRRKITDISNIQKNYNLMVNNNFENVEQKNDIIQFNDKIKTNMENIEERMFRLICKMNNYSDN